MNDDTPIEEILQHLPSEICMVLVGKPLDVKLNAILMIRQAVVAMESRGADLDPINFNAVMHGMSALAITAAELGSMVDDFRLQEMSKDAGVKGT